MAKLFQTPKLPTIEPPTPLPDEQATKQAASRKTAKAGQTTGMASTQLSAPGSRETLGG